MNAIQNEYTERFEDIRKIVSSKIDRNAIDREELLDNATAWSWSIFAKLRDDHSPDDAARIAAAQAVRRTLRDEFATGSRRRPAMEQFPETEPMGRDTGTSIDELIEGLTRQQRDVCRMLSTGCTQGDIADMLGLSKGRVSQIVAQIALRLR